MTAPPFNPMSVEGRSVRDLIDHRAQSTPDKVFVIDPADGKSLTFAEIRNSCRSFAAKMAADGLQVGDAIAYAMGNGLEVVQVILGCLYGGYLATAINLVSGKATITHVLRHSGAKRVFVQPQTFEIVSEAQFDAQCEIDIVGFDASWFAMDTKQGLQCTPDIDGLLMYTSGTTGVPKGVVHTHASLIAGGSNTAFAHKLTANDRGLCILPLYHINGFCVSLMGALVSGGSLILPKRFSVSTFWSQLRQYQCSWFSVVPTQISYLLHEAKANGFDVTGLERLRFGRSASAPLSPDVQKSFETLFNIPIIETMGLTETAAQILSNPIEGIRKIGSPGVAVGNEVMIADENLQQVENNSEGEVLVRGANVMRCYRNDKGSTNDALTNDGWLRTGDLGRMDEDGYFFITGRLKELIIKGGENIAPREIDDALYAHEDVVEAAAFGCPCENYGQKVEAAVMVTSGSDVTEKDLLEFCRKRLGPVKTPDKIHFLAELPKGPSGKIQRAKIFDLVSASP